MQYTDPLDYVQKQYKKFNIQQNDHLDFWDHWSIKPIFAINHQCRNCKEDTELFFYMKKHGDNVINFESQYYRLNKVDKKVKCTPHCFWYEWFRQQRN